MLSCLICVQLFATLWTVAHQVPQSMGFSRQEHWNGLPCPLPGDLPDPGIEPMSLTSPTLAGRFFTTRAMWEVPRCPLPLPVTPHTHTLITLTCYHTHLVTHTVGAHSLPHLCFPLDTPYALEFCHDSCRKHTHTHTHTHGHAPSTSPLTK